MTEDKRKPLLQTLKDDHGVKAVAAQNIVPHDHPAWEALRRISKMREEQESSDTFMVFWLSRLTGQMGIVMHSEPTEMTLQEGQQAVEVRAPRQFTTIERAQAWCRIHADPDNVRHLIVKAESDEVYPKTYKPHRKINQVEVETWLASMGFQPFPEIDAWSDGPLQIPNKQLKEITTWGDLIRLLDLE